MILILIFLTMIAYTLLLQVIGENTNAKANKDE